MPIYSIGHGTRPIGELINLLKKYDIAWLADLRSLPYSKFNPQFNRETLHGSLKASGIHYVYLGDCLGGRPKDPSCYDINGRIDYQLVRQQDFFKKGIDRLHTAYKNDIRLALMCSERAPEKCHRSKLIGHTLHEAGIPIHHIDEQGELKDQPAVKALWEKIMLPPAPRLFPG